MLKLQKSQTVIPAYRMPHPYALRRQPRATASAAMHVLSEFRTKLAAYIADKLVHYRVYLLVVERLSLVLKYEVHSIALLSFGQVLAFIDIKQFDSFFSV